MSDEDVTAQGDQQQAIPGVGGGDDAAPDTPPVKRSARSRARSKKATRTTTKAPKPPSDSTPRAPRLRQAPRKARLETFFGTIAMGLGGMGVARNNAKFSGDAMLVMERAATLAEAWDAWAKENSTVARIIDTVTAGSAAALALGATADLAFAIAANHELVPAFAAMEHPQVPDFPPTWEGPAEPPAPDGNAAP